MASGCFDPLHAGHIRFLEGAGRQGDFLIVALLDDAGTRQLKGPSRPAVLSGDRADLLAALRMVDAVLLVAGPDISGPLESLRPGCLARGAGQAGDARPVLKTCRRLGIPTVIVGESKTHSSTEVLNRVHRSRGKKEER